MTEFITTEIQGDSSTAGSLDLEASQAEPIVPRSSQQTADGVIQSESSPIADSNSDCSIEKRDKGPQDSTSGANCLQVDSESIIDLYAGLSNAESGVGRETESCDQFNFEGHQSDSKLDPLWRAEGNLDESPGNVSTYEEILEGKLTEEKANSLDSSCSQECDHSVSTHCETTSVDYHPPSEVIQEQQLNENRNGKPDDVSSSIRVETSEERPPSESSRSDEEEQTLNSIQVEDTESSEGASQPQSKCLPPFNTETFLSSVDVQPPPTEVTDLEESIERDIVFSKEEILHQEDSEGNKEMGKKSGSFSKKGGGVYLYSKDEFRESYATKPKPRPARRFTWSARERGDIGPTSPTSPTAPVPQERIYDSPPFGAPGSPRSPDTPSPSGHSSSHAFMTVELADGTSPTQSSPEEIDHPFVTSERSKLGPLPEARNGDINSNDTNDHSRTRTKPVPTPRRSLSTSSSGSPAHATSSRQDSLDNNEGREVEVESVETRIVETLRSSDLPNEKLINGESQQAQLESSVDDLEGQNGHEVIMPPVTSPGMGPNLSEIMCITRTVDGEEELILGAAPMFANQQKLMMDSAAEAESERPMNRSVNSVPLAARGFKNYAYIEPVDQPVQSYEPKPEEQSHEEGLATEVAEDEKKEVIVLAEDVNQQGQHEPAAMDSSDVVTPDMDVTENGHVGSSGLDTPGAGGDADKVAATDGDVDDDGGVDDAAYRLSDWIYLGTKQELNLVNGGPTKQENDIEVKMEVKDSPPALRPASSVDSLETTSSEREFKDQFSSMSLRKIKREGSILGYRKLTDITREREMVIKFDEAVKSFGFRIQYSKPAIVTEVDAGGAAERVGLIVGDVILTVNGTDVRKAPHASVVKLVKDGGSELRVLVGTNMCNSPNRDLCKPIKTGYMHKLGGQGLLKNWKRRWFVLKHDGCLYYYKTQNDADPLGAVVLTNYTLLRARDAGKQHSFKITKYKARTYYFYADTESDMNSWAKAVTEAAQKKTNSDVWLDISTHNVGLPALSIKSPDCRGVLTKQGLVHKNWKKRYCVLKDACMYYYTDMKQPRALGIVHFHGYTIQETELAGKKHGFMLVPPLPELRTYYFIADNETDRKRWVASLASSIGRWIQTNEEDEFSQSEDREQEMLI